MTYQIGYKRPPKEGQFSKGKSGNPKGRPKGSKNFMTLLDKELGQSIVVNENGKKKTVTRLQAMVKRLVNQALQGEQRSFLTLIEVMRRTGKLDLMEPESLLPENYESALDAFVLKRKVVGKTGNAAESSGSVEIALTAINPDTPSQESSNVDHE